MTRRLLLAVPLLFVVTALTFVLTALAPGDPAATILGSSATPERVAALHVQLGLDKPLWERYWDWLVNALSGNLGSSLISSQPVSEALAARLPTTLSLVIGSTLVAAVIGVGLGVFSAVMGGAVGRATDALAMLGFAVPNFWLGWILVDVFAVRLLLLPASGYVPIEQSVSGWFASLVLPVLTLALVGVTGIAKQTRDAMLETLSRDYVAQLRADGLSEARIIWKHALRNAAIPVVTLIGVFFVGMLGGTVIVETVFVLPGLGSLAVTSSQTGDLLMLQGVVVVFCVVVVLANLLVDIAYGLLNPKARTS